MATRGLKPLALLSLMVYSSAFVAPPNLVSPAKSTIQLNGFLEDLMDRLEGKDKPKEDWKEKMYKEQQEILKRRRKSGGFLDADQEREIAERRASFSSESKELLKLQRNNANDDILDAWKKARDEGKFKTATTGLQRDDKSRRLGSAGLFAERTDERLPYFERGYVTDKKDQASKEKKSPADDFFGGLKNVFGNK